MRMKMQVAQQHAATIFNQRERSPKCHREKSRCQANDRRADEVRPARRPHRDNFGTFNFGCTR
jgi:hypothetical protein